jgi:uncharacterized membrane protein
MKDLRDGTMLTAGLCAGVAAMYFFDPGRGKRRRALARDRARHILHVIPRVADKTKRDLSHRTNGLLAEIGLRSREEVPDRVISDRVRAELGRLVSHPHAVHVWCNAGCVALYGLVLRKELGPLISGVRGVRGVKALTHWLKAIDDPAHVSGLQGGVPRYPSRLDVFQRRWSPATRLLMFVGAGAVSAYGLARRDRLGKILAALGGGAIFRSLANEPFMEFLGLKQAPGILVQDAIHISAPASELFSLLSRPEKYPEFFAHVKSVEKAGDNLYHWTVQGPAGTTVSWDAGITESLADRRLSWKSIPGSLVENSGHLEFEPEGDGTRLQIQMRYSPPAQVVGHLIAEIFDADPVRIMRDDLARLKSIFEGGKSHVHGLVVTRSDLEAAVGQ